MRVLTRMEDTVKQLDLLVAGMLGIFSVMVFLFLIDYAARLLRPVSLVQRVGETGIRVIQSVYKGPRAIRARSSRRSRTRVPGRVVVHKGTSGVVLAVDLPGLVALARAADGYIEFVPQVGDFLAVDEPLFRLYGGAVAIDDQRLRASVALGTERTHGAGSDLRLAHPGRHRDQGLVGGDQRPDHRGDGDRPAAPDAARGGPAPSAQRRSCATPTGNAAPDLRHAEVGGLRAPDLHRDPPSAAAAACR